MQRSFRRSFVVLVVALVFVTTGNAQSDINVQGEVERVIRWDRRFGSTDITCDVRDGQVRLRGTVVSAAISNDLVRELRKVRGVKSIVNEVKVVPQHRIDEKIRDGVLQRLKLGGMESPRLRVTVDEAVVQLEGEFKSPSERSAIERLARSVKGVKRVETRLSISEFELLNTDEEIAMAVGSAIRSYASIQVAGLEVTVADGKATISGLVETAFERSLAIREARSVPGVVAVVDELDVDPQMNAADSISNPASDEIGDQQNARVQGKAKVPKNIRRDIKLILANDPRLSIDDLSIEIDEDSVATIRGTVDSLYERLLAGQLGLYAAEATGVINAVEVKTSGRDDASLTKAIANTIANDSRLHDSQLSIEVENGYVRLEGTLSPTVDRYYMQQLLGLLPGVIRIEDNSKMVITKPVPDDTLQDVLRKRMAANGLTRRQSVQPRVKDGVVTLTGNVQHLYQRLEAERIARFTQGVRTVNSELQVRP